MRMLDEDGHISSELRAFIENTNDIVFVKNLDFIYIASSRNHARNSVRCNGPEEVIGKTDFDLFKDAELAENYRKHDRSLLESGKEMDEFEEDYPDLNGTKQRCLTVKYVIHNKNGTPSAILGICHDIGEKKEKEMKRRHEIDQHVIDALGRQFFAANYADLTTHKYVTVLSVEYARKMLEGCETIEQAFEAFIQALVRPEYQEKMRKFCESDTIAQRVKGKTHIDCDYLSKVALGWCQASFYPTEWDEQGEVTHVLFAVSTIDKDRAKNIEEGISSTSPGICFSYLG